MPDPEEFVKLANQNEEYPVNVNSTIIDLANLANRKQFKSKHFNRAESVCYVATSITVILLLFIWMHFEFKESAV